MKIKEPEYTFKQTLNAFDGWANKGQRLYPIEASISALYYLERGKPEIDNDDDCDMDYEETIDALDTWIKNDVPKLPDYIGLATLFWLKKII